MPVMGNKEFSAEIFLKKSETQSTSAYEWGWYPQMACQGASTGFKSS